MLGKLHGVDRQLDIHVALDLAAAAGVDEFLGQLGDNRVAVIPEPIDERPDWRTFLFLAAPCRGSEAPRASACRSMSKPSALQVA